MISRFLSRSSVAPAVFSRNHLSPYSFEPRCYFEADNGKNPTGGDNKNPQSNPHQSQDQIEAAVSARIAQLLGSNKAGGDPMEALTISIKAQHRLEKEVERLKEQVKDAPDSSAVKSLREQLDKYSALGKPEEIEQRLSNESTLATEKEQREKADAMSKAVQAAGFDPDKFSALKGSDELSFEVKTEGEGDSKKTVAYATFKDGDKDVTKPLSEVVTERWPSLADSLKAVAANGTQTQTVTRYGQSAPAQSGSAGNEFDAIRREREAKNKQQAESSSWMEQAGVARNQ